MIYYALYNKAGLKIGRMAVSPYLRRGELKFFLALALEKYNSKKLSPPNRIQ